MDTIDGMRVYARVVKAGSFTAAARDLGISNALASKYVRQLEERLGARLLNRTTRRVSPTEIGAVYHARCVQILGEFDELEAAVGAQHRDPRGTLRVAGPRAFGEDLLMASVATFMHRYPEIVVDVLLEEREVDVIAEGFDLAIRVSALRDSSMIARRVAAYPYWLCAAPDYLSAAGRPAHPDDLERHACIVNAAISPTNQWQFTVDGVRTLRSVSPRARVNTAAATATLVRAGLGIGLCLYSTVRDDLAAGRLVRLLQDYEAYDRSVFVIYPHSRHLSAKVRAFVDHLLDDFSDLRQLDVGSA